MTTSLTVTRRDLVAGLFATPLATAWPLKAYAIEPMTVLAAGAAVVGIVSGVTGFLSDERREAILRQINSKLDAVIRNQEVILAELRALRFYFDEALYGAFRQATIIRMNAHQDRYEVLVVERVTDRNRAYFTDLEDDVAQTAFELGQYDTPAYIAFGAGVGMTLALHQAAGRSRESFKSLRNVFARPYRRWLNPDDPKSIIALVNATKSEVERRSTALNARPRTVTTSRSEGRCTYTTTITISGDLANGFNGAASTSRECEPPQSICERNPNFCPTSLGDEFEQTEGQVANSLLGMLSIATPAGGAAGAEPVTVPQFVPSGFAVVDEMNRERIAIFELMNLQARQQIAQQQMEECLKALTAPI